jgi:hypothetical protein
MIKLENDGYVYISKSGLKYELLEGVTMGAKTSYTSDIIFIMLSDIDLKIETPFVNFFYGASFINESIEEYEKIIGEMVEEYEKNNKL